MKNKHKILITAIPFISLNSNLKKLLKSKNISFDLLKKVTDFEKVDLSKYNGIIAGVEKYDKKTLKKAKQLKSHGMVSRDKIKRFGYVSRMDNLQAAILNFRLKTLNAVIKKRRKNFELYKKYLNTNKIFFSDEKKYQFNTYHTFVIQTDNRDQLKKYLLSKGIETAIHYPIPLHLQPPAKYLGHKKGSFKITEKQAKRILTLPIHQYLKNSDIKYIADNVNYFHNKK